MGWTRYLRRSRRDADFAREVASYIEIETDENIARGMTPEAARFAAVRKFGNPTRIREDVFLMNSIGLLDTLWQDLRFALRLLARDKGFALAAILSLTLGIGANTAIFQLLDAVRLQTLPVDRPQELAEVRIGAAGSRTGSFFGRRPNVTYPMWEELQRQQQAFAPLFAWSVRRFDTSPGGEVHAIEGMFVSGHYFEQLGVRPLLGRVLSPSDDRRGCGAASAVISHAYWQRELGGDPAVLTRAISLDGFRFPIVGVTPQSFFGMEVGRMFDVAIPVCSDDVFTTGTTAIGAQRPRRIERRDAWWLAVAGRLQPGWTIERATDHLASISARLFEATLPTTYDADDASRYLSFRLNAFPASAGVSNLRTDFQEPLIVLLATAGLVLVIACANLANLLLARASARGREIAVRLAIGASRSRIVRQLIVESAVLAVCGTVLGALLAGTVSRVLVGVLAGDNPAVSLDLTWNWRMLGFTTGVASLACLLFGVAPALRATALAPNNALKAMGRGLTAGRDRFSLRRGLVVTQVALSMVLLLGALLFTRTLYNLLTTDAGFDHRQVVVATVTHLSRAGDRDQQAIRRDLRDRLAVLPDVAAVAQADVVPLDASGFWNEYVRVEGAPAPKTKTANFNRVSPGYFTTLDVRLVAGRDVADSDTRQSVDVAVVSKAFVTQFSPDASPLGRIIRVELPGEPEPAYEIVGVVEDTKLRHVRDEIQPMVYLASTQEDDAGNDTKFVLRPRSSPAAAQPSVTRAIAELSPTLNVEFRLLSSTVQNSLLRERLMASLSAAFGVLAVLLAAIGLYGVMSYMVARRVNEIGIRMAMGAERRDVIRMILGEAGWLVVAGLVAGTVLAMAAGGFARSLLFQLSPTDPTTVASAIALLAAVGLLAGAVPARRASRVDPAIALRDE
jgi:putative ABC transport system permease protein